MTRRSLRSEAYRAVIACLVACAVGVALAQDGDHGQGARDDAVAHPTRANTPRGGRIAWTPDLLEGIDAARRARRPLLLYFTHDT